MLLEEEDDEELENLGTVVDRLDVTTNKKTKKGSNQWIQGNHEFGVVNIDAGSSVAYFPADKKKPGSKLMELDEEDEEELENLAKAGSKPGSYTR